MSLLTLFGFTQTIPQQLNISTTNRSVEQKNFPKRTEPSFALTVFSEFFPPDYAPTGQLLDELTQALSEYNLTVNVFSNQPAYAYDTNFKTSPRREQRGKVRVRRSSATQFCPSRIRGKAVAGALFFIRSLIQLFRLRRSNNLLLLTTAPPFLPLLGIFASLLRIPYVCLIYDLYPDIAIELGVISSNHLVARSWRALNRITWLKARKIIVLSPAMKQALVKHVPRIENKISIIHSWANTSISPISKNDNSFARQYGLDRKFTILYSGNMGRCHDMITILEAAKHLRNEPIQFVFIGGGAQYDVFAEKATSNGLTNCKFLPYQSKAMLPLSLTACDVSLVSVSMGMESLVAPSKLYSALASGRPIAAVCPKGSYLSSLIAEANCGSAFENGNGLGLADYIRFLSTKPEVVKRLGSSGRKYLDDHFTLSHISSSYFDVFEAAYHNAP